MIVIEGVDNSGKSTLARSISSMLPDYQVQVSEGPPKFPGEMNQRVKKYLGYSNLIIFDRHPCVSDVIYNSTRAVSDPIDPHLLHAFYEMRPIFIYCDPGTRGLDTHIVKGHDTDEHLKMVNDQYRYHLEQYREWAIDHATITYRIGDPMKRILMMVETTCSKR